jgi:hypothetical protein
MTVTADRENHNKLRIVFGRALMRFIILTGKKANPKYRKALFNEKPTAARPTEIDTAATNRRCSSLREARKTSAAEHVSSFRRRERDPEKWFSCYFYCSYTGDLSRPKGVSYPSDLFVMSEMVPKSPTERAENRTMNIIFLMGYK